MNPSHRTRLGRGATALAVGCAALACGTPADAKPVKARESSDVKCTERDFMGKRLSAKSFGSVLEWQPLTEGKGRWRDPQISTPISSNATVTLLHFWAHWCEPCKRDFPAYAALATKLPQQLFKVYDDKARGIFVPFLYLAEDTPSEAMEVFLTGKADLIRGGVNYQDAGGQIQRDIERLSGCKIGLPLTLVVDKELRVLASFAGSIESRRDDLLDALIRVTNPASNPPPGGMNVAGTSAVGGPS